MSPADGALAWVDGQVVPLEQARVPLDDRGFLIGDGCFETLRTAGQRLFRWDLHRSRLAEGLDVLGLDLGALETADRAVADLEAAMHGDREWRVRINVSAGPLGDLAGPGGPPRVSATCRPLAPYAARAPEGLHLVPGRHVLQCDDPLGRVKHLSYLPRMLAKRQARAAGADDALLLNDAGRLAEGTTSNVMAVLDGVVHAPGPEEGALAGVTRTLVLQALHDEGTPVVERLEVAQMLRAEEAFVTNTTGGAVPIASYHGRRIGGGPAADPSAAGGAGGPSPSGRGGRDPSAAGPVARRMQHVLQQALEEAARSRAP